VAAGRFSSNDMLMSWLVLADEGNSRNFSHDVCRASQQALFVTDE